MSGLAAAAGSFAAQQALRHLSLPSWDRTNFAGHTTSLSGGLDVMAGLLAGSTVAGRAGIDQGAAPAIAAVLAAAGGYVDDHLEQRFPATGKGFKGHLGALREGRVSSGIVKIAAAGAGSLAAAGLLARSRGKDALGGAGEAVFDAAIIALTANLMNLLDLRPGRARKAAIAIAAVPAAAESASARAAIGAASAGIAADLDGRTMLGDLGANALGAHLGVTLACCPPKMKVGILAALVALNAASEKVSFSHVIENTPGLRELDLLGRSR